MDNFPSTKIDTFSRVALHGTTHYSSVGPQSALDDKIIDATNNDRFPACEPPYAHGHLDPQQDNQPGKAEINADSFAWISLESFISRKCSNAQGDVAAAFFTENPPPYIPVPNSDAEDEAPEALEAPAPAPTPEDSSSDESSLESSSESNSDDKEFDFF